jgi:hypothetical protein
MVLWPQISFRCSVWYIHATYGFIAARDRVIRMIESIQKQALTRIAGAFRTTTGLALTTCLHVMPVMVALNLEVLRVCLCVCTSPLYARIQAIRDTFLVKKELFY